jgi:hypothetical protein
MMPLFFLAEVGGRGFGDFYKALIENDIGLVIDIRLPRGFDLEGALQGQNELHGLCVEYQWLKYFGNPFFDRDDPVESYIGYLTGMDKELDELYYLVMKRRCCIADDGAIPEWSCRRALAEALKAKYHVAYADLTMAGELVEKYGTKGHEK